MAALQQARLDLSNTTVIAPADGVVTNLRLSAGQYVNQGQPLLSFIQYGPRWISAAMRENQLGNLAPGNKVLVALDDNPGKLFPGRVESIGWGITQGGEAPTGHLARRPAGDRLAARAAALPGAHHADPGRRRQAAARLRAQRRAGQCHGVHRRRIRSSTRSGGSGSAWSRC